MTSSTMAADASGRPESPTAVRPGGSAGDAPCLKIASLTPERTSFLVNSRLLDRYFPLRVYVRVTNPTDTAQRAYFAPEIIGDLNTRTALARELVELPPHQDKVVWVKWTYPTTSSYLIPFMDTNVVVPKPTWGQTLRVSLVDDQERVIDRMETVFAIDQDGGYMKQDDQHPPTLDAKTAFMIRYSGYLRNDAFTALDAAEADVRLTLHGAAVTALRAGEAPNGLTTVLTPVAAHDAPRDAVVTFPGTAKRLRQAWLLLPDEPSAPVAVRLYARPAGRTFTFSVPPTACAGTLVLEEEPMFGYAALPSLADFVGDAEKTFGPARALNVDSLGRPIPDAAWPAHRAALRTAIWNGLYQQPELSTTTFDARVLSCEHLAPQAWLMGVSRSYTRQKIAIITRPGERMNLWVLIPDGVGPFPAVLSFHQTYQEGMDETVGLAGSRAYEYGPLLASRGYVVVAPESITIGERVDPDRHGPWDTLEQVTKDPRWSLIGERLHDHVRVLDFMQTLPYVDMRHVGAIGHSLGGESLAMVMAADDRIQVGVASCIGTLLRTWDNAGPQGDGGEFFCQTNWCLLPNASFRKPMSEGTPGARTLPFDFDDVATLWAPRPIFISDVTQELWQNAPTLAQAYLELQKVYAHFGISDRFSLQYSDSTHSFPQWLQQNGFDWLDYWLTGPQADRPY